MDSITPLALSTGVPFPALAPLSAPMIAQILHQHVASRSVIEAFRQYPASLTWLLQVVRPLREQVARDLAERARTNEVTSRWFLDLLRTESLGTARPETSLLSNWRGRGLIRASRHGFLDPQRVAAVLLARRLLPHATRNWLPDEIVPHEPVWWCWRQDGPTEPITVCPVPLPPDVPASALVWVPWAGAAWLPDWTTIATGAFYCGGVLSPQAVRDNAALWHTHIDSVMQMELANANEVDANTELARQLWSRLATPLVLARFEPVLAYNL